MLSVSQVPLCFIPVPPWKMMLMCVPDVQVQRLRPGSPILPSCLPNPWLGQGMGDGGKGTKAGPSPIGQEAGQLHAVWRLLDVCVCAHTGMHSHNVPGFVQDTSQVSTPPKR